MNELHKALHATLRELVDARKARIAAHDAYAYQERRTKAGRAESDKVYWGHHFAKQREAKAEDAADSLLSQIEGAGL